MIDSRKAIMNEEGAIEVDTRRAGTVAEMIAVDGRYGDIEVLGRILSGIASAAAGLLIAVVAKMAAPLFAKRWDFAPLMAILAFIGVALMHWPLPIGATASASIPPDDRPNPDDSALAK